MDWEIVREVAQLATTLVLIAWLSRMSNNVLFLQTRCMQLANRIMELENGNVPGNVDANNNNRN